MAWYIHSLLMLDACAYCILVLSIPVNQQTINLLLYETTARTTAVWQFAGHFVETSSADKGRHPIILLVDHCWW
jgi:hypothetical protein